MKPNRRSRQGLLIAIALVACTAGRAIATLVAPHALFIDHRDRSAALFLHNSEDRPVEISIELVYGYPRGDGEGGVKVFLDPAPAADEPSCAGWIRALPRRVVLQPGQRQTVRLLARPPAGLPDGEYWSRVLVTSRPLPRGDDLAAVDGHADVRVGLNLATRTIISLNYRKGPVATGLAVEQLRAHLGQDTVTAAMEFERQGDAAWLGQVEAVLLDAQGEEIQRWQRVLAVYDDHRRVLEFPLDAPRETGPYTLSLTYSTDRGDLSEADVLPASTVVRSVALLRDDPAGSLSRADAGGVP